MNIKLNPVDESNLCIVKNLSVSSNQTDFIETVDDCLCEAKIDSYGIKWRPIVIYCDNEAVGFSMYGKSKDGEIWLDRFMIDENFQGRGFGKNSFKMIIERIISEYKCHEIYLSVNSKNTNAISLYEKMGFYFNDEAFK